jgi:putative transposase
MKQEYAFSERRACGLVMVAVSTYRYEARRCDEPLRTKLVELAREKPRFGYRRLHVLLRRCGERVNHKKLYGNLSSSGIKHSTKEA